MNIKSSIQLIEYSSTIAVTGFLLLILTYISIGETIDVFNIFFFAISFLLILTYVFKNAIIKWQIHKSKYKQIFHKIIDSIQLEEKYTTDYKNLKEIKQPDNYTLCDFLKENRLNTFIGQKKNNTPQIIITFTIYFILLFFASKFFNFNINYTTILFVFGAILISFYFLFQSPSKYKQTKQAIIAFDNNFLMIFEHQIAWKDIINWQYRAKDKSSEAYISIHYKDALLHIKTIKVELNAISASKIDLILLLTVYKEKYGFSIY